jgi:hypothetical protein
MAKDGICPICGYDIDIVVRCGKFINDKHYNEICFICFSCIKTYGPIDNNPDGEWQSYPNTDVIHLRTKKEMAKDGWSSDEDQKRVNDSLKSLKSIIKKSRKKYIQEDANDTTETKKTK